jgi:hypothetical protein
VAVTRKPKRPDEAMVQRLIHKGGSVATDKPSHDNGSEFSPVILRIPSDMLARIDAAVQRRRPVRISRHSWIIEALHERLSREQEP